MTTLTKIEHANTHGEAQAAIDNSGAANKEWSLLQLWSFRAAFVFVLQLVLPLQWSWYQRLLSIRSVQSVFQAALGGKLEYFTPPGESGKFGIGSFASWGIALAAAVVIASVWTWISQRRGGRKEYRTLYYWLRLLARYWVAVNIMNYGYMKVFPNQMPFPSISNLHTLFGEHAPYRLYWQAVGLVTWYEVILGCAEVFAGILLFFRSTAALGALLNFGILYNVGHANLAYDGAVHIHSFTISFLALFVLLQYVPDVWRLVVLQQNVTPNYYRPAFPHSWQKYSFLTFKWVVLLVFIPGYAYFRYDGHYNSNFSKEPRGLGLTGAKGYYTVTEFQLNGKEIPYSPLSSDRWHDVVFEDYPTLTYKVNRPFPILLENGSPAYRDVDKIYELAGFSGGRRYYNFEVDEKAGTLTLQNKYKEGIGEETFPERRPKGWVPKAKKGDTPKLIWHFSRPSPDRITLSGLDEEKNSFYAVLDRDNEPQTIMIKYPVQGRPLQYTRTFDRRLPIHNKSLPGAGGRP